MWPGAVIAPEIHAHTTNMCLYRHALALQAASMLSVLQRTCVLAHGTRHSVSDVLACIIGLTTWPQAVLTCCTSPQAVPVHVNDGSVIVKLS